MTYTGLYDNLQPLAKNAWSHLAPKLNIIKRNLHICNHCLHPSLPLVLLSTLDLIYACLFPHFHLHIHKQGGGEEDFHELANPINRFIISCEYQHVNVTQWQLNLISPNHFIGRSERSIVVSTHFVVISAYSCFSSIYYFSVLLTPQFSLPTSLPTSQ